MTVPIRQAEIARRIAEIDAIAVNDTRGKAFEDLVEHVFASVGCTSERNIISPLHAEQIDLAVCHMGALDPLPNFFIVECKFWNDPLPSAGVAYFINTCRSRKIPLGILMSRNGLTGNVNDATYAHSLAYGASSDGVHLIMLTLENLEALTCNDDLIDRLRRAWIRAIATGGVGTV